MDIAFVPSGFDSHSLISISTGFESNESFADLRLEEAMQVRASNAAMLTNLIFFINISMMLIFFDTQMC